MTNNTVRIIGGMYRGRKLSFPDAKDLRPTGDRIRETLFNWLTPYMENARCLDLFAGSGALGLEAVSRGAKSVTLVDSSRTVCDHLNKNIQVLQTDRAQVVCAEASDALQSLPHTFDVIFVDPPFNENKMSAICQQLAQVLSRPAWIYTESGKHQNFHVPPDWEMIKNKSTGKVSYRLYRAF